MVSRAMIDEFLSQKHLALAGVSRDGKGFGHVIRKELTAKGYQLHLVHPEVDTVAGEPCVRHLADIAGQVGGLVLVTSSSATEKLVVEAAEAGIGRLWMQQGAESDEAIRLAEKNGLSVVHHHCILMFAEPAGLPHRIHRWFKSLVGGVPRRDAS